MKIHDFMPQRLNQAAQVARRLEAAGYDCVAAGETKHDAFLAMAAATQVTSRAELMTSIAVAFSRNPMILAQIGHDLNAASGGRFVMGLGSQVAAHITRRFSMPWSRPAARMREMIQAMHAIWDCWYDGKPLRFEGEFYTHTLMTPNFMPEDLEHGRPRVAVAAVGPAMTRVASEVADGMLCHGYTTRRYLTEVTVPTIEAGLAEAGRKRSDFEIAAQLFTVMGDSEAEIAPKREAVRHNIAFYSSTPAYRAVLECHGWGDLQPELHALSKAGRWDDMAALVTDEMVETFAFVGTPEQVAEAMAVALGGKVDRIHFPSEGIEPDRLSGVLARLRAIPTGGEQA